MGTDRTTRGRGPWVALALVAVLAFAAVLCHREVDSPDVGFQLALGRWITAERAVPHVDPLTYTLQHRPYVDLQWLYQVVLWRAFDLGGTLGIVLLNTAGVLASLALVALRCARREGRLSLVAVALLLLATLANDSEIRPHVASWVYLNLVLLALEAFARGRRGAVGWLPPLMLLWGNTHSLYPLGIAAIGCYGLAELPRWHRALRDLYPAGLAAALLGALASPYGVDGLLFPLGQLGMLQEGTVFKGQGGIVEFLSPLDTTMYTANRELVIWQAALFMQVYGVVALLGLVLGWRRTSAAERLVFLAFTYVFWRAQKNTGYFVVATLPVAAAGWRAALAGLARPRARPAFAIAVVLASGLLAVQVLSGWYYANQRLAIHVGHRFNEVFLPVRAAEFLNTAGVPDAPLLNTFNDGGYLGFATGRRVFIDGRAELTGAEFYAFYSGLESPFELERALLQHDIRIVVVPHGEALSWIRHLEDHDDWRRVHSDGRDVVYLREGFAPSIPAEPPPRPGEGYPLFSEVERDALVDEAIARRDPNGLTDIWRHHAYPMDELRTCFFFLNRGLAEPALAFGLAGLRVSTVDARDALYGTGHALWALGLRDDARRCYRAVLDKGGLPGQQDSVERTLAPLLGSEE